MTKDINDRAIDGTLPRDPKDNVIPLNKAAQERDEAQPSKVFTVRELLDGAAERAANPNRLVRSCTTGHYELDDLTGGLRPGFVWVLDACSLFPWKTRRNCTAIGCSSAARRSTLTSL